MNTILLSIHPKWCELIADGKKTIEVRKTRPKIDTPFKCYIYETKGKTECPTFIDEEGHEIYEGRGQVIGEFVCDWCEYLDWDSVGAGRWHGEDFKYEDYFVDSVDGGLMLAKSCLTRKELIIYNKGKCVYGWHISDLETYDKPKELKKFRLLNGDLIEKAPQSWCYVKEIVKEVEG